MLSLLAALKGSVSIAALMHAVIFAPIMPAAGGATLTYISTNQSVTSATSHTYTSQSIGAAASDRVVVVGIFWAAGGTAPSMSGVTIGGSAATLITNTRNTASSNTYATAIAALAVPAGTTANIVLSFTGTIARSAIAVYSLNGTSGVVTAFASNSTNGGAANPHSLTLATNAGGCMVWVNGCGSNVSHSLAAPAILDVQPNPASNVCAMGHQNDTTTSTTFADTITPDANLTGNQMTGACW